MIIWKGLQLSGTANRLADQPVSDILHMHGKWLYSLVSYHIPKHSRGNNLDGGCSKISSVFHWWKPEITNFQDFVICYPVTYYAHAVETVCTVLLIWFYWYLWKMTLSNHIAFIYYSKSLWTMTKNIMQCGCHSSSSGSINTSWLMNTS